MIRFDPVFLLAIAAVAALLLLLGISQHPAPAETADSIGNLSGYYSEVQSEVQRRMQATGGLMVTPPMVVVTPGVASGSGSSGFGETQVTLPIDLLLNLAPPETVAAVPAPAPTSPPDTTTTNNNNNGGGGGGGLLGRLMTFLAGGAFLEDGA